LVIVSYTSVSSYALLDSIIILTDKKISALTCFGPETTLRTTFQHYWRSGVVVERSRLIFPEELNPSTKKKKDYKNQFLKNELREKNKKRTNNTFK
jgi:hypothetical protein